MQLLLRVLCCTRRPVSRAPCEEADEVDRVVLHGPPLTPLHAGARAEHTALHGARRRQRSQLGLGARALRASSGARQGDRRPHR